MSVLSLNITVPTAQASSILQDFCDYHSYKSLIDGKANPETQAQFAKRKVIEFVKGSVIAQRAKVSTDTARQTSIDEVSAIVFS
jgi:hypothetical protein